MSSALTVETLERVLQRPVDDLHLAIAKHEIQGVEKGALCEIFACSQAEIQQVLDDPAYGDVKKCVALELAKFSGDTDISWDSLEHSALTKLHKSTQFVTDPEFFLRVAALANKAQRRNRHQQVDVLSPVAAGTRVQLTLTERFVEKLKGTSGAERTVERKIDIANAGSHRVSAQDVATLLQPRVKESAASFLQDLLLPMAESAAA